MSKQELDKLNSVNVDFHGAGESTTDLSLGIVQGRIPGGVAIMWHKKYDRVISVIRLKVNWCIGIKVTINNNVFIVLNVYTPYESPDNEVEYFQRLAFINSFIEVSECTCIYVMVILMQIYLKSTFGQHLTQFSQ